MEKHAKLRQAKSAGVALVTFAAKRGEIYRTNFLRIILITKSIGWA